MRATSEQQALGHDKSTHGGHDWISNACGDELRIQVIHAFQSALGASDPSGDASGYPNFSDWPKWNDITHQKMWVEWIRRAHTGGLNVMVALAVNNKTLGDMTVGPGDYATDDKSSADRQIAEIKSFVGRHPDFMAVALTSADVYRIVSAKKLAVVIGIEVDHIGTLSQITVPAIVGLGSSVPPSDAAVKAEIDRLYGEGVRYIFPIHLIDNAFGGAAAYESIFDAANVRQNGRPYALVCANPADPKHDGDIKDALNGGFTYSNASLSFMNVVAQILKTGWGVSSINSPQCPPGIGQKNSLGLTASGRVAIKEMMRLGMLIDVDHMSQAAADSTLAIATQFGYPINSGHNGLRGALPKTYNERALRADQYKTIGALHGMAGVGSAKLNAPDWLKSYKQVIDTMGGGSIVGAFGTDTDGLEFGMPPRVGPQWQQFVQCSLGPPVLQAVHPCSEQFPNAFESGVQYSNAFPRSTDGNRTWDLKWEGVAHYGMLPDFLQDVKSLPGGATMVASFMTGADYFYQTWKIAETKSTTVR